MLSVTKGWQEPYLTAWFSGALAHGARCDRVVPGLGQRGGVIMFPKDEDLPTWLHTVLLVIVVSPFAGFLLFHGLGAILTSRLSPIMGPDFGVYLISAPLAGSSAVVAGLGLLSLATSFLGLAYSFSRFSSDGWWAKAAPWVLLAGGLGLIHLAER